MEKEYDYVLLVWEDDLKENNFISFLADAIRRNNGIVCSFLRPEQEYGSKYFARVDYKEKYPNAKIIDIM